MSPRTIWPSQRPFIILNSWSLFSPPKFMFFKDMSLGLFYVSWYIFWRSMTSIMHHLMLYMYFIILKDLVGLSDVLNMDHKSWPWVIKQSDASAQKKKGKETRHVIALIFFVSIHLIFFVWIMWDVPCSFKENCGVVTFQVVVQSNSHFISNSLLDHEIVFH